MSTPEPTLEENKNVPQNKSNSYLTKFLKDHPALIFTFSYVFLSSLGMIYNYTLYHKFKLNVFDFIEINDFFVAAFRQRGAFYLVLEFILIFSILLARGVGRFSLSRFGNNISLAIVALVIVSFPFQSWAFGAYDAKQILCGKGDRVTYSTGPEAKTFKKRGPIYLIGSTEKFYFFYHKKARITKVINVANLNQIETINKKRKNKRRALKNSK